MLLCSAGWAPAASEPCRAACPHLIEGTSTQPLRWFWSLFKIGFILTPALFREGKKKTRKAKHTCLVKKVEHLKQLTPPSSPFKRGSPLGLCIWWSWIWWLRQKRQYYFKKIVLKRAQNLIYFLGNPNDNRPYKKGRETVTLAHTSKSKTSKERKKIAWGPPRTNTRV